MLGGRNESDGSSERASGSKRRAAVDRDRFEEVALPHLDSVYRLARSLTRSEAEAQDLVQETYIRAYRAFSGFELREYGPKPWLFRILYNAFYTLRGRQKRQPTLLDDVDFDQFAHGSGDREDVDLASGAFGVLNWEQIDDEIKSALERLQPEYRAVLLLWSFEDLSYKEIAEVCDCALGTVMSRLFRARRILARELVDYARERRWPTKRCD